MKQEASSRYVRRVTVRFKPEEYERFQRHHKSSTYHKLGDNAQKILLNKLVVVNHCNQLADEILAGIIQLKEELRALGNNFKQATNKLHTLYYIYRISNLGVT